ncbi:MAG: guanylate kinase [Actinomycetota bacterium]|jgi:guanylate kinase
MSLIVLAGPAGVGKGSIVRQILGSESDFVHSVSATTRQPRPGEVEGVDYHFVSRSEFERLIAENELLEYAVVHGSNYYGTPLQEVTNAEALGKHLIMEIDLQGARQLRERVSNLLTVFVHPPSWEELERRLRGRGTESEEQIQRRLETARLEIAAAGEFDHEVVNTDLAETAQEVVNLVRLFERGK